MDRKTSARLVSGLFIIQALLILPAFSLNEASAAPPSPTSWTRYAGNPLITAGPSGSWDNDNVLWGGSLVDTGNEFYLYYKAVHKGTVGLAISTDCRSWTKYSGNPVWNSGCNPAVMMDGTTWKMWYLDASNTVCYATSSDGKGWTASGTTPMKVGSAGTWDSSIWSLCVIKDTGGYKMYYTGTTSSTQQFGYATSPDETSWTKYAQNPIVTTGPSGSFDDGVIQFPWVMKVGNEYRMWYGGYDGSRTAIGYANSSDGIAWNKYAQNPVLSYGSGWDAYPTNPMIVQRNNTLEMMYVGYDTSWSSVLGLAESVGSTPSSPTLLLPQSDQWINDSTPSFSWRFGTPSEQTSFELQLDAAGDFAALLYDTGKQSTNASSFTLATPVADGMYYWRIKAWDLTDFPSGWSLPFKVKIDSTPPQNPDGLASTSHPVGVWSRDNTVDVRWTLPPFGGNISGYAGFGTLWDTKSDSIPEMMDLQDDTAKASTSQPSADTDGLYFHIRARDRAGNWATGAVHAGPFPIDASPPFNPVRIISPSHIPQYWSNDSTMDMTWTEPDGALSGTEGFSYLWDRQSYTLPQSVLNVSADVLAVSSPPLSDANDWYFHLRTKDRAGNWALSAVHSGPYWIDTTPPSVLDLAINGGAEYATCGTVRAILRAEDAPGGSGLAQMRWALNDAGWGAWETYSGSAFLDLAQGDGAYSFRLEVRDEANNTSPAVSATITLDRTLPAEAQLTVNGGAVYTNGTAVSLGISARDPTPGSGLWNMSFSDDGKNWDPWLPFCESCPRTIPAGDGNTTVFVRLRDRAGNVGPVSGAGIVLDTTAPVTFIPMLPALVHELSFDINWTAADATSGVASFYVQFQDQNGTWMDWLAGTCQTGARFTGLDCHTYRFRARAVDRAGNRELTFKEASGNVSIELPPPFLTIGRPAADATLKGKFTVSGTAGHPRTDRSVVQVEVRIDEGPWRPARGNLSWSYQQDSNRMGNGRHTITVRAFDGTRYSAEESRDVLVENEPSLNVEGMPLFLVIFVIILAAVAAGTIYATGRRRDAPVARPMPYARQAPPPPTAPPVFRPGPQQWVPPVMPPPLIMAPEPVVPRTSLAGAPGPAQAPPAIDEPAMPRKPRTAEEEQSMRESKVLKALSSLPRGLPSSLWGIEMDDLAARVVSGVRTINDDGEVLVKINNRWYFGDETNLGLFMQQCKER